MNILVVGNGGREHALGYFLSRDPRVKKLFFASGNAGTASLGKNLSIKPTDLDALANWARKEKPDLTVVGPETPLCLGIVDRFEALGLKIFGPNKSAARLEGSKIFTKELLVEAHIPTARSKKFSISSDAMAYSRTLLFPQVIKADGLAAGKGVIIAQDMQEAQNAIADMLEKKVFGAAGNEIIIEEFLDGQEMSVHAVTDGKTYKIFPSAQDHKRVFDNDQGPNTGGMGAYAPSPLFTAEMRKQIEEKVFIPLLKIFQKKGIDYRGVLYAGLMITPKGPYVLEFNARFGDPETQVIMPLLQTPLLDVMLAVVEQKLDRLDLKIKNTSALTVVLAAPGYPSNPKIGSEIFGLNPTKGLVFHAGTKQEENRILTAGGRVLCVTGEGMSLQQAYDSAYALIPSIQFEGMHYRKDIGWKALKK
ncbi:MAG: phosphoribosylamine--glycine ligase [Verrucomicrobiota bacterium]